MKIRLCCCILVLLSATLVRADITIDNYSDATNDRFTNSNSFILDGFDLSGIGHSDIAPLNGRWATAISRNVVISQFHGGPAGPGTEFHFYPGNDPTEAPVLRTVVSGEKVGDTDLYVAVLDSDLPSSIAHYNFATEALVGTPPGGGSLPVDAAGIYDGMQAYMFGLSPFDEDSDPNRNFANDQAVGTNIITGYSENVPFDGNSDNDSLILEFEPMGDPDHTFHEAFLIGGDSGAPLFVDVAGDFRVIGINAFTYGVGDFVTGGTGSGVNYIGNEAAFISGFIAANASVPEPSSIALLVAAGAGILLRRRSRVTSYTSRVS